MTYFEHIGGDLKLLTIIDDFVERVCADTMIGFFFSRVDRTRLKRLEYEHAARFLGADIAYTGRALNDAHRRHPIMGGHFARRRQILKQTLERHGVPPVILEAWLAHQDALKAEVTPDTVTQCIDKRQPAREQELDERPPEGGVDAREPNRAPNKDEEPR